MIASLLKDDQDKDHVADIEFIAKRIAVDSVEGVSVRYVPCITELILPTHVAGTDTVTSRLLPPRATD